MRGRPGRPASSPRCTTSPTAWSGPTDEIERRKALIAADAVARPALERGREPARGRADQARRGRPRAAVRELPPVAAQPRRLRGHHRLLQLHAGARLDAHRSRPRRCRAAAARCASTRTSSRPSTASCSNGPAPRPITRPRSCRRARAWFDASSEGDRQQLLANIMAGLPGAFDRYDIPGLRRMLERYHGMTRDGLRENLARFLREVIPTAEEVGIRMCIHPDDPPRPTFGLPRIVGSADDLAFIVGAYDSDANGITFCTGSLGAGPAQRRAGHGEAVRGQDPLRSPAQRRQGARRLVHGGRAPRRRRRHGGGRHHPARGAEAGAATRAIRAGASRSGRTTATSCSTTSASRPSRATRPSAACAASPRSAAS